MTDPLGDLALPFPIEFVIPEVPRCHQSASPQARDAWRRRVREAAAGHVRTLRDYHFLDERPLAVTIYYFPARRMQGDVDNIVKLILDGMLAVLYPDDRLIERVTVQKFEPGVSPVVRTPTPALVQAIGAEPPMLYVRLDDDLSWRLLS